MPVRIMEITSLFSKAHDLKSLGSDKIQNYWLKVFPADQRRMTNKL